MLVLVWRETWSWVKSQHYNALHNLLQIVESKMHFQIVLHCLWDQVKHGSLILPCFPSALPAIIRSTTEAAEVCHLVRGMLTLMMNQQELRCEFCKVSQGNTAHTDVIAWCIEYYRIGFWCAFVCLESTKKWEEWMLIYTPISVKYVLSGLQGSLTSRRCFVFRLGGSPRLEAIADATGSWWCQLATGMLLDRRWGRRKRESNLMLVKCGSKGKSDQKDVYVKLIQVIICWYILEHVNKWVQVRFRLVPSCLFATLTLRLWNCKMTSRLIYNFLNTNSQDWTKMQLLQRWTPVTNPSKNSVFYFVLGKFPIGGIDLWDQTWSPQQPPWHLP